MKTVLVVLLSVVAIAFVPTATAGSCAEVTEPALGTSPVYLMPNGVSAEVWTEANQIPGLQRSTCQVEGSQDIAADSHWVTVGPTTASDVIRQVEDATGCQIGVPIRCIF